jgi:hypothetical protein
MERSLSLAFAGTCDHDDAQDHQNDDSHQYGANSHSNAEMVKTIS